MFQPRCSEGREGVNFFLFGGGEGGLGLWGGGGGDKKLVAMTNDSEDKKQ